MHEKSFITLRPGFLSSHTARVLVIALNNASTLSNKLPKDDSVPSFKV